MKGQRLTLDEARRQLQDLAGPALDAEMRGKYCCAVLNVRLSVRPIVTFNTGWSSVLQAVKSWLKLVDEWTVPGPEMYDEPRRLAVDLSYELAHQDRRELPTLRVRAIDPDGHTAE